MQNKTNIILLVLNEWDIISVHCRCGFCEEPLGRPCNLTLKIINDLRKKLLSNFSFMTEAWEYNPCFMVNSNKILMGIFDEKETCLFKCFVYSKVGDNECINIGLIFSTSRCIDQSLKGISIGISFMGYDFLRKNKSMLASFILR